MRKCNQCNQKQPDWMYKTSDKKTCRRCEYRWWREVLRMMVRQRKLTPIERMSSRIGYMGTGFLIAGQWTLEPLLFMTGFICVIFQVAVRRQWNLVALQLNGLIAWTLHFINSLQ
tara:strand:+ start:6930 stop:7274 length:345 start_codon:yes stop_codon:yes gene_type:complete